MSQADDWNREVADALARVKTLVAGLDDALRTNTEGADVHAASCIASIALLRGRPLTQDGGKVTRERARYVLKLALAAIDASEPQEQHPPRLRLVH